jgi:predicted metalloprotease with PDZ domain
MKRGFFAVLAIFLLFGWSAAGFLKASSPKKPEPDERTSGNPGYRITLLSLKPLKLSVSADIPIDGKILAMDDTYPAELPEMAAKGWPALISNLTVSDADRKKIELSPLAGNNGWQLAAPVRSTLHLSYEVDYSLFAAWGWSSPLESAFEDNDNAIVAGRSVFITSDRTGPVDVEITTPESWIPIMPWPAGKDGPHHYSVRSAEDLTNNMLVFSRNKPDVARGAGFQLQIVSMGHWQPLRSLLRTVLNTIISREVALMRFKEKETYNVVLLPIQDEGGNAFRQSFVYCFNDPNASNKAVWANTLAHEIFHYWNYARLEGADYASSQWFQEGFTEYVANLIMAKGKITDQDAFLSKLSRHVNNYRKLTTTLENYGTHKGPPLYSAGALVAFDWDLKIRNASAGKRDIGDLFRNLMAQTDSGRRKYTWSDIRAALQKTAAGDWEGYYQAHIKGREPLPLEQVFRRAGLRLGKLPDGKEQVERDPASKGARAFRREFFIY